MGKASVRLFTYRTQAKFVVGCSPNGAGFYLSGSFGDRRRIRQTAPDARQPPKLRIFTSGGLFETNGINGRQMGREGLPGVAAILTDPKRPRGGTKRQTVAAFVYIESVPIDQIVGVLLRKALGQCFKGLAAVAGAVDHHASIHRITLFVFNSGNEPCRVAIMRVRRNRKTKRRGLHALNLTPGGRCVRGFKNAVVMLNPEHVRMGPALRYQVRVLGVWFESALRRHVRGAHSSAARFPGSPSITRFPDTAAGDTHDHMPRIARIDTNRVNAWMIRAAAEPFFAAWVIP